jgi:hypothetical protein
VPVIEGFGGDTRAIRIPARSGAVGFAAAAVTHPRDQVKAAEIANGRVAPVRRRKALVVLERIDGGKPWITNQMIKQKLTSVI